MNRTPHARSIRVDHDGIPRIVDMAIVAVFLTVTVLVALGAGQAFATYPDNPTSTTAPPTDTTPPAPSTTTTAPSPSTNPQDTNPPTTTIPTAPPTTTPAPMMPPVRGPDDCIANPDGTGNRRYTLVPCTPATSAVGQPPLPPAATPTTPPGPVPQLPVTGAKLTIGLIAVLLVALGAVFVLAAARRRGPAEPPIPAPAHPSMCRSLAECTRMHDRAEKAGR